MLCRIFISSLVLMMLVHDTHAFVLKKFEKTPKTMMTISNFLSRYNRQKVMGHLREFVGCCRPSRFPGTEGHEKVAPWLISRIKELDPSGENLLMIEEFEPDLEYADKFYQNDFDTKVASKFETKHPEYKKWQGFTKSVKKTLAMYSGLKGKNVIWEKKGYMNSKDVLVIGAHFDTIAYNPKTFEVDIKAAMPGADDNGTGVAFLLSLIDILSELELPKTIRIVFFDFQELGFLGSKAYVEKHTAELKKNVVGYINVEMIGNDSKIFDKEKRLRNFKAYIRNNNDPGHFKDKKLSDTILTPAKKSGSGTTWEVMANSYDNSDHSSFWKKDIPAVAFTQNLETDYSQKTHHTSNDFPETLNANSFYQAFKSLAGGIIAWSYDIKR